MTGTSTPSSSRSFRIISGTAAAASSVLTVTRTSWDAAWASRATWIAVASASAVSVFVIDWTTTGWAEPTRTPPTSTETVGRRRGRRESGVAIEGPELAPTGQDPDEVEAAHPDQEGEQEREPDHVGEALGAKADPTAEDRLEDDHQDPAAVEGRERKDVHEGQVRREDAGHVQRQDRTGAEEDVADLRRDADGARDGRRRRRIRRYLSSQIAEAAQDDAEPVHGLVRTDTDGGREVAAVVPVEAGLEGNPIATDPERTLGRVASRIPWRGVDLGLAPERQRD